jgi:hypothetical protein
VYGVFERKDPRNPYLNYTIVNVLYCSGDNHLGDVTRDYNDEEGVPIQQVGVNNVLSVLNWVKMQQRSHALDSKLSDLVIMGCSAGSIASQIWANEIIKEFNYPRSSSVILDSYIGLFPQEVEGQLIYEFGICNLYFLPSDLKDLCLRQQISMFDFIYSQIDTLPSVPFLFIHPQTDRVQIKYYNYVAASYNQSSLDTNSFIATSNQILLKYNSLSNFVVYYIDSDQHCYTPTPYLYYTDTKGMGDYGKTDDDDGNDEINVGDDDAGKGDGNLQIDMNRESLNKWISRVPLQTPGTQISSQCGDDICNTSYNNSQLSSKIYLETSSNTATALDYQPSPLVKFVDSFPHWNSQFESQEHSDKTNTTSSYSLSDWDEYLRVMIPFPVLLHSIFLFIGLLLIFIVMMRELGGKNGAQGDVMIYTNPSDLDSDSDHGGGRSRGESDGDRDISFTFNQIYSSKETQNDNPPVAASASAAAPNSSSPQQTPLAPSKMFSPQYLSSPDSFSPLKYYSYFHFFIFLFFLFNFFYFIGYADLHKGITSSLTTIHHLQDSLSTLDQHLSLILEHEDSMTTLFSQTTCDGGNNLRNFFENNQQEEISNYQKTLSSSLSYLHVTEMILQKYFMNSLNLFIFLLFSVNLVIVFCYLLAVNKRYSSLLLWLMIFTILIFVLSMIFTTIYLVLLVTLLSFPAPSSLTSLSLLSRQMALSDYCYDPIEYLLLFLQPYGNSLNEYVSYYLTCSGLSPFYDTLYSIEYLLKDFHFYLFYLEDTNNDCFVVDNESSYLPITSHLQTLASVFPSLYATLSCEDYSEEWVQLIQSDICGKMFNGLFVIWILQLVMNGFLLCIVIYCSYLYPYLKQFGLLSSVQSLHNSSKRDPDDDESSHQRKTLNPLTIQTARDGNIEMI